MNIVKLAYSMKEAAFATSYSRTYLYSLINEGRLKSYKRKGRTFIKAKYLEQLIDEDARNGER